jgi:hypothetical protein
VSVIDLLEQPCPRCRGDGDVASGEVDEDGDECPPVLCPRCGGTGHAIGGIDRPGYVKPKNGLLSLPQIVADGSCGHSEPGTCPICAVSAEDKMRKAPTPPRGNRRSRT